MDIKKIFNPYRLCGDIYSNGVAFMLNPGGPASVLSNDPTSEEIVGLTAEYFYSSNGIVNEISSVYYPRQLIDVVSINTINNSTKPLMFESFITSLDEVNEAKNYIYRIRDLAYNFHKNIQSINILGQDAFITEFTDLCASLEEEILISNMPSDSENIPLVALSALKKSFEFWNKVYTNTLPGDNWYTYLTVNQGIAIETFDWRGVLTKVVEGAIIGSIAGEVNNETFDALTICGAAGAIANSVNELLIQVVDIKNN